jgi:DNA-binding LacI/PurR family transcriptional regulator
MAEAGLPPSLHFTGDNPSDAADLSRALLSTPDRPTAIFGMNSHIMLGLMTAAKALNLTIPAQLAIAGFEDFEWACFVKPALTLVRQPAHEIGTRAAQLLFSRLRGEAGDKIRKVVLAAPLIVRESCGCPVSE